MPGKELLVNGEAGRTHLAVDRWHPYLPGADGVRASAEEHADPPARREGGFGLMSRRLEHDRSRADGAKVHDLRQFERESLVWRYLWVGGRGSDRTLRHGVVPVHSIPQDLGPETDWSTGLRFVRSRERADYVDSALCDRVKIVVMRRAGRRVDQLARSERLELLRLEAALVIAVEAAYFRSRHGYTVLVD